MKIRNQNSKQGFTLLELLMVVLIIGILAAIALPQYRKAVAKAELAQIIDITKTLKQAQERYFLTNNKYAANINGLDITTGNTNIKCEAGIDSNGGLIMCYNKNFALWHYMDLKYSECATKSNDQNSPLVNACKNLTKTNCSLGQGTTCARLGLKPCYFCPTYKPIF